MKIIPRSDLAQKHDIKRDLKRVVMTDTKEAREERAAIREQLGLGRNYKPIKRQPQSPFVPGTMDYKAVTDPTAEYAQRILGKRSSKLDWDEL